MKLVFKTIDFNLADATFTVNELSKDGFFHYLSMKDANERYNFILNEIVGLKGLEDSDGKPISIYELKEINAPWNFVKEVLGAYGDAVFAETSKELADKKEKNQKNVD